MNICFDRSWQSSYSKAVNVSTKCYEVTTVVPRPLKLDTTASGTGHLISRIIIYIFSDPRTCVCLTNTGRIISCWLSGTCVKHEGGGGLCDGVVCDIVVRLEDNSQSLHGNLSIFMKICAGTDRRPDGWSKRIHKFISTMLMRRWRMKHLKNKPL